MENGGMDYVMIYAVVTLYNPSQKTNININNICKQVDYVFLCDNSHVNNRSLFEKIENCTYLYWGENLGLSKAFNNVLKEKSNKFLDNDFIVFFDQDSTIKEKHISNLVKEYILLEKKGYKVGCLGPIFFNTSRNDIEIAKNRKKICDNIYSVKSMITSSMLCKYKDIKKVGFWNEDVFLDMADWDLCWRFIDQQYLCCVTEKVLLYHSVGESEKKIGIFRLRIGKTFREYYQIRESLYLLKRKYTPFRFRIRLIQILTIRTILRLIFLDNRRERFFYIKLGYIDYIQGKHCSLDHLCMRN